MSKEISRLDHLWFALLPVMHNYYEWVEHPEHYISGQGMDQVLAQIKRGYGVTPEEWADLEKRYHELQGENT